MVIIGGLQKSSLIDYPEKISAIIFTQGCNFKCPYCHNPELHGSKENHYDKKMILDFLATRVGKLEGVVITGGEPTLHKNLPGFIAKIKALGFCVKLDTNGTNPEMLQHLLDEKLLDYLAMDIKAPIYKYAQVVCANVSTDDIKKSINILQNSSIGYEFRTTVVKSQLLPSDITKIGGMIKGDDKYCLQKFMQTKTLDDAYIQELSYSDEEFWDIVKMFPKHIKHVQLR